jgi:group II intron reverse transcriptase/maturase
MSRTLNLGSISTRILRIAKLAGESPTRCFLSLSHSIDASWLKEAYERTRKDGAVGVDGQTAEEYGKDLGKNLASLLDRFKSGRYYAPPVRRAYIPKVGGKRPLGIPTFEDKVLQRAVVMLLEPLYETVFLPCSYGFRPGHSAHQALEALRGGLMSMRGGWVLEVDIRSFFDNLRHRDLRRFLDGRVRDGVIRRTIDKWLRAGVLEEGSLHRSTLGTPQGGVISPLLANVYLHEVVDAWFEHEVKPRLYGEAFLVRYADDFVLVFALEADARRVWEVLPKRLARFGLELHPDKTRLLDFRRPSWMAGGSRKDRPGSFEFLGFVHHWGRSRKGNWAVMKKTASSRLSRTLQRINQWCRQHRHAPVDWQWERLSAKYRGHMAYYGVTGNIRALQNLRWLIRGIWRKWLNRRSQRARMSWRKFLLMEERYPLPRPRIVHQAVPPPSRPWYLVLVT